MELYLKVVVFHSYYGCETGCCGHRVEMGEGDFEEYYGLDTVTKSGFTFSHPYGYENLTEEEARAFAEDLVRKELGEEHVKDLDWGRCIILDD